MYLNMKKTAAGKAIIQCAKSISTLKHARCSAAVNPETTNTYSLPKISLKKEAFVRGIIKLKYHT